MKQLSTLDEGISIQSVEPGSGIGGLNPAWPTGNEPVSQGNDHLQNIKQALQNSFPGFGSYLVPDLTAVTAVPSKMNFVFDNIEEDDTGENMVFGNTLLGGNFPGGLIVGEGADITGDTAVGGDITAVGDITAFYVESAAAGASIMSAPYEGSLSAFLNEAAVELDKIEELENRIKDLETVIKLLGRV